MDALNAIDIDHLQALIAVLRDGGVQRFSCGGDCVIEFPAPADPEPVKPEIKQPLSSTGNDVLDGTPSKHPGYSALFGGALPKFPASQE